MKTQFSRLKEVIQKEVENHNWHTILGIVEEGKTEEEKEVKTILVKELNDKEFKKLVRMGSLSKIESNKDKRIAFELINQRREQKSKLHYEKWSNRLEIEQAMYKSGQLTNTEKQKFTKNTWQV